MEAEFLRRDLALLQSQQVFRLGTDAMVLAHFVRVEPRARVCDLCAGGGALSLLLLAADPTLHITALELQPQAVALMEQSAARNRLGAQLTPLQGDVRQIRTLLQPGSFRHVVCNPPYYPVGAGFAAGDPAMAIARTELCCTLEDVVLAAAWLLPTGGSLWMVHRPERLTDLLCALRAHDLEPKQLQLVCHRPGSLPAMVLVQAVRGGRPSLRCQAPLVLRRADGSPTEEYLEIYHMAAPEEETS